MAKVFEKFNQTVREPYVLRSHAEVSGFFDGLEILDPGIVPLNHWCEPGTPAPVDEQPIPAYGVLARKP
jgi:S-adenosyl methyltransferase